MGKRSYGTGRLFVRCDRGGREVWYGTWWAGGVRVKRRIGLKRSTGRADGLSEIVVLDEHAKGSNARGRRPELLLLGLKR